LNVFFSNGCLSDRRRQAHRQVELLLHEREALHLHLPAAEVERGEDLIVRRGRGVRHVRLVEGLLGAGGELLIVDVDHRTLPQRGQRLVRRLGRVHADRRVRRRQQVLFQPHRIGGWGTGLGVEQALLLLSVRRGMGIGGQGVLEGLCRDHGRALARDRVEPGEGEPRLVPEEDEVGFDRQAFGHHLERVVDDAVERAVRQGDHPHLVEPARGPVVEQQLLDPAQRHRPVEGDIVERVRLEVRGARTGEHERVVVGLVAVAVDHDHFVG
jgi:hypothetical protein